MEPGSCDAILIPTVTIYKSSDELTLNFLNIIEHESYSQIQQNAKASTSSEFVDFFSGLYNSFDLNGSYDKFQEARSRYFEQKKFDISTKSSREFVSNGLPEYVVKAWVRCHEIHSKNSGGFFIGCSYYNEKAAIITFEYVQGTGQPATIKVLRSTIDNAVGIDKAPKGEFFERGLVIHRGKTNYPVRITNDKLPLIITLNIQILGDTIAEKLAIPPITSNDGGGARTRSKYLVTFRSVSPNATIIINDATGEFVSSSDPAKKTETDENNYIDGKYIIHLKNRDQTGKGSPITFHCVLLSQRGEISITTQTDPEAAVTVFLYRMDGDKQDGDILREFGLSGYNKKYSLPNVIHP